MTLIMDELIGRIENGEPVAEEIRALDDVCVTNGAGRTLFDIAIGCDNREVIEQLAENRKALAYSAPVDVSQKEPVKHAVQHYGIGYPVADVEAYLENAFGDGLSYGRTPLLTACRLGNDYAMQVLLRGKAKVSDKDLLGLTAPELCLYSNGEAGLEHFLAAFKACGQKQLPVSPRFLRELFASPDLLAEVCAVGKLGAPAQRLAFCYHCARLDLDALQGMLAQGFDFNKAITARLNPVEQVCTSQLLWEDNLPDSDYFAYHLKKYYGPAGSHSVHIDNRLINEDGSNLGQLMAEAERKRKALLAEVKTLFLDPADEQTLLEKRCVVMDALLEAGLDIALAESKLEEGFFNELQEMGLAALVTHLGQCGFSCGRGRGDKSVAPVSDVSWELAGESCLSAELLPVDGSTWQVRVIHSNIYGPVDGVRLELRVLDADGNVLSDWRELACSRELLDVDGDLVERQLLKKPVYDEMPWQAIYKYTLEAGSGAAGIALRLYSDNDETLCADSYDGWSFAPL